VAAVPQVASMIGARRLPRSGLAGLVDLRALLKRSPLLLALVRSLRFFVGEYTTTRRSSALTRTRTRAIRAYLSSHPVPKLQLGAGPNALPGWLNSDLEPGGPGVIFLDATRPFPFPDGVFDYVFSEHLIEHVSYADGLRLLREVYRVLKPGGRTRIATPNLEALVGLYAPDQSASQRQYVRRSVDRYCPGVGANAECFVINNFFYNWDHRFIYDASTLRAAMEAVGFTDISR
jgi:SAM-dependent methyltransferase